MNPARSLGPIMILGDYSSWWAYAAGPLMGAVLAVGVAWLLRGRGGGISGRRAGSGTLGELWQPGPIGKPNSQTETKPAASTEVTTEAEPTTERP